MQNQSKAVSLTSADLPSDFGDLLQDITRESTAKVSDVERDLSEAYEKKLTAALAVAKDAAAHTAFQAHMAHNAEMRKLESVILQLRKSLEVRNALTSTCTLRLVVHACHFTCCRWRRPHSQK